MTFDFLFSYPCCEHVQHLWCLYSDPQGMEGTHHYQCRLGFLQWTQRGPIAIGKEILASYWVHSYQQQPGSAGVEVISRGDSVPRLGQTKIKYIGNCIRTRLLKVANLGHGTHSTNLNLLMKLQYHPRCSTALLTTVLTGSASYKMKHKIILHSQTPSYLTKATYNTHCWANLWMTFFTDFRSVSIQVPFCVL